MVHCSCVAEDQEEQEAAKFVVREVPFWFLGYQSFQAVRAVAGLDGVAFDAGLEHATSKDLAEMSLMDGAAEPAAVVDGGTVMDRLEEALAAHTAAEGQNNTFAAGFAAFGKGVARTDGVHEQMEMQLKQVNSTVECGS